MAGMVLNALWPLLANAGPADFSAPVCSAVGTKSAPNIFGGLPTHPTPAKLSAPHCPFCAGSSDYQPALASAANVSDAQPAAVSQPLFAATELPLSFEILAAHPRGPPAFLI